MRWNPKETGCGEHTNLRANLWSNRQKPYKRLCVRVRLRFKSKPNNYMESCMINLADEWRKGNIWYLGRSVQHALKRVTTAESGAGHVEVSRGHSSKVFFLRRRGRVTNKTVIPATRKLHTGVRKDTVAKRKTAGYARASTDSEE